MSSTCDEEQEEVVEDRGVQLVVQRCHKAELLVDNKDEWVEIGMGLVVYISFAKGATEARVLKAARTLLHLPLVTEGKWGDGVQPSSVLQKCAEGLECSILVVPQASLSCKVKGKALNYRGQLEKDLSTKLYELFVSELSTAAYEAFNPTPRIAKARKPELPPEDPLTFFHSNIYAGKYLEYDERGVPTRTSDGKELSKSHIKKLERLHFQQVEKYKKHLARHAGTTPHCPTPASQSGLSTDGKADQSACTEVSKEISSMEQAERTDVTMRPRSTHGHQDLAHPKVGKAHPDCSERLGEGDSPEIAMKSAQTEVVPSDQPKYILPRVVAGTFGNLQGLKLSAECGPFTHILPF
eukprot:GGOE01002610.1.p1 GENE.GGOE01002610.1~~GGOE01002610.1.p1  ORF type:complete len:353 (-),score=38.05 GGOE01002610.1:232-1290(-)